MPSLKLSASNPTPAARLLLFLITYKINILFTQLIIFSEINLEAQVILALLKLVNDYWASYLQKLSKNVSESEKLLEK
jgi:hypothetical protein